MLKVQNKFTHVKYAKGNLVGQAGIETNNRGNRFDYLNMLMP